MLTRHHQLLTSAAFYWPCTIIYQQVLHHTGPVPPSMYKPVPLSNVRLSSVDLRWAQLYVSLVFENTFLRQIYFKNVAERVLESFGVSLFQEMCPTCRTTSTNGKTLSKDCIFPPLSHIDPFNFKNSLPANYIIFQQLQPQVEIKQCQKCNRPESWVLFPKCLP